MENRFLGNKIRRRKCKDKPWSRKGLKSNEYYVEKLVKRTLEDGETKYVVKWKYYPHDQNTTENIDNLTDSLRLAKDLEEKRGKSLMSNGHDKQFVTNAVFDQEKFEEKRKEFDLSDKYIVDVIAWDFNTMSFIVKWDNERVSQITHQQYQELEDKSLFKELIEQMDSQEKNIFGLKYNQQVIRFAKTFYS